MFKKNKSLIILLGITLIGLALRFWKLDQYPVSLNWDEVSHGYNAFSILKTGRDEWGNIFPLIFRAFGDYKLPVYIYLTVIPVLLFGLNAFSVRFISALAGTLAIPGIYFLTNALFKEKKMRVCRLDIEPGHLAAFLIALTPWHLFISRPALEANLALTFVIYGFFFLLKALSNPKFFLHAAILLGLSLHTYNSERVFVPMLFLVFVLIFRRQIRITRSAIIPAVIFLLAMGIVVSQVLSGTGTARYGKLKILSENAVYQIGLSRQSSTLPQPLPVLLHNRPVYFVSAVAKNYIGYFSPQFLYQTRGVQTQFAIPIKNLFSLPITILFIVGVVISVKSLSDKNRLFLMAWLFLSPLAASLTADPPQSLRPNPMIPAVIILAAFGWLFLLRIIKPLLCQAVLISVIFSVSFALVRYLDTYYGEYAHYYSDSWQYGYSQMVDFVKSNGQKYDKIFITKTYGEPHIFYAFYNQLDPKLLWPGENNIRYEQSDWFWTDRIGKIYFVNQWDIPQGGQRVDTLKLESGEVVDTKGSLLVTTFNYVPDNVEVEEVVEFVDGRFAFVITSVQ